MKKAVLVSVLMALLWCLPVKGQDPQLIAPPARNAVIDSLASATIEWTQVGLNGKISSTLLPVRPSLRIFMERGSEIIMSLRVPFFGEIGRAEIVGDDVIIVNKHNKTYIKGSINDLKSYHASMLQDIQDFILGEPVIFGSGTVSATNEKDFTLYDVGDGTILLKPTQVPTGFDYGYVIAEDYLPALLLGTIGSGNNIEVGYSFANSGKYMLEFLYQGSRKTISAELEFNEPDYSPKRIERIQLGKEYKEVTVKEFLSRF